MMAANAARHLGRAYDSLAQSVERLSSGLRINSAKDDAAGLAVRELIRADIAVLNQGSRNAQDGISMLQTMEGAMATVDDNLVRMKELAEQAATGSYSDAQREIMNAEFVEMAAEIERTANSTEFNDINMLNTNSGSVAIHVGTAATIDINKVDMTKSGLNIVTGQGQWTANTNDATGVTSASSGSWVTIGAGGASFSLDFGEVGYSNDATGDGEMGFGFAAGTYTLQQVVDVINAESLNPETLYDGQGNSLSYKAAEVVELDDGTYGLKLKSRGSIATAMSFMNDTSIAAALAGGFGVGTATNDNTDLMSTNWVAAGVFEYWNTSTSVWAPDESGRSGGGLNVLNVTDATSALATLDAAINAKDTARASFGYKMNRLESTIAVLDIQAENLMTAESRISDVDVATEMANLTRAQVLSQAGVAMLAQANAMPQMALTLLRG